MTPIGLTAAAGLLAQVRERLDAQVVAAGFETAHGEVTIVSDGDGLHVTVNGQPVPSEETG